MEATPPVRRPSFPVPAVLRDLLEANPSGCFLLAPARDERGCELVLTNTAARRWLGLTETPATADLFGCLDDGHERAFRRALAAADATGQPQSARIVARRADGGGPILLALTVQPIRAPDEAAPATGAWLAIHLEPARPGGDNFRDPRPANDDPVRVALLELARATHECTSLEALLEAIDRIVERTVGTRNLYVALIDEAEQQVRFVYQRDEYDVHRDRPLGRLGLTDLVYLTGEPLLVDRSHADRMLAEGKVVNHGVPAQVWLGVPLKVAGRAMGVLAVQDYHDPRRLGEAERQFLTLAAQQIACAIALRRSEAETVRARADEARATQAKGDFLAGMSHDLRSPLSVILGYAELLAQRAPEDGVEVRQARCIVDAAWELQRMADRILDFSRLQTGARRAEAGWTDLDELVLLSQAAVQDEVRSKDLSLRIRTEGELPAAIRVDGDALRQLLSLLLDNAVRYTAAGTVTLRLRALDPAPAVAQHCHLILSVDDTGPGLPAEIVAQPFQPHATGPMTGRRSGRSFGLGLATAHRLALLLGARLHVETAPGVGTRISLSLTVPAKPRRESRAGETPSDPSTQIETIVRHRLEAHGGEVLVAGGDDAARSELAALVELVSGRAPAAARTAGEALVRSREQPVTVVLIVLGRGSPENPAHWVPLRTAAAGRPAPMILVCGPDHSVNLVDRWLREAADQFLPHPLGRYATASALLLALDRIDQRRLAQPLPIPR